MSRWIVILLIALLPLRAWSSAGMAASMAAMGTSPSAMAGQSVPMAMPDDCPMMSGSLSVDAGSTPEEQRPPVGKAHHGCLTCSLCMTPVLRDVHAAPCSPAEPARLAIPRVEHYASADIANDSKPPIR